MSNHLSREPLTSHFLRQHRLIRRAARLLARYSAHVHATGELDPALVRQFVHFFRGYLHPHHEEEERILFPWLRGHGLGEEPLANLVREHAESRAALAQIADRCEGDEVAGSATSVADLAKDYATKLATHDWKEDHILYPLADLMDEDHDLVTELHEGYTSCRDDPEKHPRWVEDVESLAVDWPDTEIALPLEAPVREDDAPLRRES